MAFAQAKTLCLSSGSAEGTAKLLYSGDMDLLFAETHKDLGKYGQEIIAQHSRRKSMQDAHAATVTPPIKPPRSTSSVSYSACTREYLAICGL